eukprot:7092237-Alexandrium_andersonii.AAC.1
MSRGRAQYHSGPGVERQVSQFCARTERKTPHRRELQPHASQGNATDRPPTSGRPRPPGHRGT